MTKKGVALCICEKSVLDYTITQARADYYSDDAHDKLFTINALDKHANY